MLTAGVPVVAVDLSVAAGNGVLHVGREGGFKKGYEDAVNAMSGTAGAIADGAYDIGEKYGEQITGAAIVGFFGELGRRAAGGLIKATRGH